MSMSIARMILHIQNQLPLHIFGQCARQFPRSERGTRDRHLVLKYIESLLFDQAVDVGVAKTL